MFDITRLSHRRLLTQHLTTPIHTNPAEVVRYHGATQAQDYLFAKWSLAQRLQNATDLALETAFSSGAFLRTHVMRPTWFFVHPDDIRWMLALTAPRVHQLNATYYRKEGVNGDVKRQSMQIMEHVLAEQESLTRDELYALFRDAGLIGKTPGLRGIYILMHAELEGLICSGPMRGKQQSYALIDRRAPHAKTLPADESLVELARRYFISHGPATRRDFARWSGLTLADTDHALESLKTELEQAKIDDNIYWFDSAAGATPSAESLPLRAFLLSGYDECLNGYASWGHATARAGLNRTAPDSYLLRNQMAIVDGQIVGVWGREVRTKSVRVAINPFFPLTSSETEALHTAAAALGAFYQRPAETTIGPFSAQ